jgi:hypothetical protein
LIARDLSLAAATIARASRRASAASSSSAISAGPGRQCCTRTTMSSSGQVHQVVHVVPSSQIEEHGDMAVLALATAGSAGWRCAAGEGGPTCV